jgi:hypothetical protein
MKKLILIIAIAFYFTGCGGSGGGGAAAPVDLRQTCEAGSVYPGDWIDAGSNRLTLATDCYGTEFTCQASFTYYKPVGNQVLIDIESTLTTGGCPGVGEHVCSVVYETDGSSEYLTIDCGNGSRVYIPD